jgi:xanthine dehydrogenase accessory factor
MVAQWLEALTVAERDNQPAVLVTVLAAKGSTPREAGAKMVVCSGGLAGTIGGGNLEHQCEAAARTLLATGAEGPSTRDFPLGPALGQCCGGHVTVLFEVLRPPKLQIALFGAGHVGKALVKLLADLPCRVNWIDPRPEALPTSLPPNIIPLRTAQPAQAVATLTPGSVVLVMTHDHALDFEIVAAALSRSNLQTVGLIGSDTKRARFASRLTRQGIDPRRLICPIGLPGIEGKEPAIVAISVAAQILQLHPPSSQRLQPATGPQPSQRSFAPMPELTKNCGDCVCPPVPSRVSI